MPNKVIALNPRYQAGLDYYQKRTFRGVYLGASDRAKRYYEISFYGGSPASFNDTEEEDEQTRQDLIATYQSLTDEDWDYIIGHVHWGMAKWGLGQARKKYGKNRSYYV